MPTTRPILTVRLEATGEARRVVDSLRVGRVAENNDWVLDAATPRPRVSRAHCCFAVTPEGCSVTDLASLNGTFLNGQRLPPHTASPLRTGDEVAVGGHRFRIEITAEDTPAWPAAGTASPLSFGASGGAFGDASGQGTAPPLFAWPMREPDPPPLSGAAGGEAGQGTMPPLLAWPSSEPVPLPEPSDPDSGPSALEKALQSLIDKQAARLPFGNRLADGKAASDQSRQAFGAELWPRSSGPQHEALPVGRPDPTQVTPDLAPLAAFLAGAGLTSEQVGAPDPAAFLHQAGSVFAAMAEGYQQLLAVRRRIKLDAHLKRTQDGAEANNPLKHALDGPEAVQALLQAQGPAYLRPCEAVHDAVQALAAHELAMLDAFQAAIADLLEAFHPRRLEGRLNAEGSFSVLARGGRRASLWELYVERYAEIVRAARTRSLGAFDDAFRDAYERRAAAVMDRAPAAREDVP